MEFNQTLLIHLYLQDKYFNEKVRARGQFIKVISDCNSYWPIVYA